MEGGLGGGEVEAREALDTKARTNGRYRRQLLQTPPTKDLYRMTRTEKGPRPSPSSRATSQVSISAWPSPPKKKGANTTLNLKILLARGAVEALAVGREGVDLLLERRHGRVHLHALHGLLQGPHHLGHQGRGLRVPRLGCGGGVAAEQNHSRRRLSGYPGKDESSTRKRAVGHRRLLRINTVAPTRNKSRRADNRVRP